MILTCGKEAKKLCVTALFIKETTPNTQGIYSFEY